MSHSLKPWKPFRNISAETHQPIQGWHISAYDWVSCIKLFERHSTTHEEKMAAEREVEANAYMVAAAPEMYDVLVDSQELLRAFDSGPWAEMLKRVQTAIAKAKPA